MRTWNAIIDMGLAVLLVTCWACCEVWIASCNQGPLLALALAKPGDWWGLWLLAGAIMVRYAGRLAAQGKSQDR